MGPKKRSINLMRKPQSSPNKASGLKSRAFYKSPKPPASIVGNDQLAPKARARPTLDARPTVRGEGSFPCSAVTSFPAPSAQATHSCRKKQQPPFCLCVRDGFRAWYVYVLRRLSTHERLTEQHACVLLIHLGAEICEKRGRGRLQSAILLR